MNKEIITCGHNDIEKRKVHRHKKNRLEDEDIDSILIFDKVSVGEKNYKYFIGYMDYDYKTKPFRIILPKPSAYVKRHDGKTK